jgi:hypothetical protein
VNGFFGRAHEKMIQDAGRVRSQQQVKAYSIGEYIPVLACAILCWGMEFSVNSPAPQSGCLITYKTAANQTKYFPALIKV